MSTADGPGGHAPRGKADRPAPLLDGAPRGGAYVCGPLPPSAPDLAIVDAFGLWLAGDRSKWDDQGLPRPREPEPAPTARTEQLWASANNPDGLCPCGHPWGIHDVDEYRGDGSEMCCVTGCAQTGCPGQRPREQWESSSEEGA